MRPSAGDVAAFGLRGIPLSSSSTAVMIASDFARAMAALSKGDASRRRLKNSSMRSRLLAAKVVA
jgi:hypothetical protein